MSNIREAKYAEDTWDYEESLEKTLSSPRIFTPISREEANYPKVDQLPSTFLRETSKQMVKHMIDIAIKKKKEQDEN